MEHNQDSTAVKLKTIGRRSSGSKRLHSTMHSLITRNERRSILMAEKVDGLASATHERTCSRVVSRTNATCCPSIVDDWQRGSNSLGRKTGYPEKSNRTAWEVRR